MQEYLKVMKQYEIQANIINQRESNNDNIVLFIGDNYFITNSIQVTNIGVVA